MTDIDPHLARRARQQDGAAALSQVTHLGTDRHQVRNDVDAGRLLRIHRGVYLVDGQVPTLRQQLRAAHLHLGSESTVILRSALAVHGIQGAVGSTLPQLAVPPGLEKRQRPGVDIHVWAIANDHRFWWDGIPVTSVVRTLADASRLLPRLQAVACLDSALNLGLISADELPLVAELTRRRRHCVAGRRRIQEVHLGAQSPLETRVRLRASDAGLPPDELQVPIHDDSGWLLGYGDMGYRLSGGRWLIVEADGRSVHELPEAVLADRHRQNAFLATGRVSMIRFTWDDTLHADTIPQTLRAALATAGWRPPSRS